MVIRFDNSSRPGTGALALGLFLALLLPLVAFTYGASSDFNVSVSVSNGAPTVQVDAGQTISGSAGAIATVNIFFNATDPNGYTDLNDSTARVTISKAGEASRTSSPCAVLSNPTENSTRYNCSLSLSYFDAPGDWTIDASINDSVPTTAQNTSVTVTVGTLDAISLVESSINFSGSPGTQNIAASPMQQVNNTGNTNYTTIQVTGIDFASGSDVIGVSNVTMNVTDSGGSGDSLLNNSAITLADGNLTRGQDNRLGIRFWLDIPESIPSGSYAAPSSWTVSAS